MPETNRDWLLLAGVVILCLGIAIVLTYLSDWMWPQPVLEGIR